MKGARAPLVAAILAAPLAASGCGLSTSAILAPDCSHKATLDAELHVDPTDDRWIWAIDRKTGQTLSLRLGANAPGVSTTPPAIIDAAGNEIGKTGDLIVSGCYDLVQNAYQIDGSDLRPSGG
jgi:hypothetical protein